MKRSSSTQTTPTTHSPQCTLHQDRRLYCYAPKKPSNQPCGARIYGTPRKYLPTCIHHRTSKLPPSTCTAIMTCGEPCGKPCPPSQSCLDHRNRFPSATCVALVNCGFRCGKPCLKTKRAAMPLCVEHGKNTSGSPCYLLALPKELRVEIWRYLISERVGDMPILGTCKLVYEEVKHEVYLRVPFKVFIDYRAIRWQTGRVNNVPHSWKEFLGRKRRFPFHRIRNFDVKVDFLAGYMSGTQLYKFCDTMRKFVFLVSEGRDWRDRSFLNKLHVEVRCPARRYPILSRSLLQPVGLVMSPFWELWNIADPLIYPEGFTGRADSAALLKRVERPDEGSLIARDIQRKFAQIEEVVDEVISVSMTGKPASTEILSDVNHPASRAIAKVMYVARVAREAQDEDALNQVLRELMKTWVRDFQQRFVKDFTTVKLRDAVPDTELNVVALASGTDENEKHELELPTVDAILEKKGWVRLKYRPG